MGWRRQRGGEGGHGRPGLCRSDLGSSVNSVDRKRVGRVNVDENKNCEDKHHHRLTMIQSDFIDLTFC